MLIGLVLERALFEHRLQCEALPSGAIRLAFAEADPEEQTREKSNHVVDKHEMDKTLRLAAETVSAVPSQCLGNYLPLKDTRGRVVKHNRFPVWKQYHGISTSESRRKSKREGPPPHHHIFMSLARNAFVVAPELGQKKGHLLRMNRETDNPLNADNGLGVRMPAVSWQASQLLIPVVALAFCAWTTLPACAAFIFLMSCF